MKYLQKLNLQRYLTLSARHVENIETSAAIISEWSIVANLEKWKKYLKLLQFTVTSGGPAKS